MVSYVNVHAILEGRRNRAKASSSNDPDSTQVYLLVWLLRSKKHGHSKTLGVLMPRTCVMSMSMLLRLRIVSHFSITFHSNFNLVLHTRDI